jgi:phospholipase/carboxylesterase/glyoxalase family protein
MSMMADEILREVTMVAQDLGFVHRYEPAPAPGLAPTLLLLHGTGGNENDLLDLGRVLAPGAALLSPRGKVLEHGLPRFFRRLAEGIFDLDDLKMRTHELAGFVAAASAAYGFDPQTVIAVGFSNGANIAASTLLLHPGLLAAAVLFHPMVPLVPEPLPDLSGTDVFVGAGRLDRMAPPAEAERLVALLRQAGADVTLCWQQGGHSLSMGEVEAARLWLAEWID